jgi:hypothetical protein
MAKAGDLIGRSGAAGLGPSPKTLPGLAKSATEAEKEASKAAKAPKKQTKPSKVDTRSKGGAAPTTSPSIRPKV